MQIKLANYAFAKVKKLSVTKRRKQSHIIKTAVNTLTYATLTLILTSTVGLCSHNESRRSCA